MGTSNLEPELVVDLSGLRRFVTLTNLVDLVSHREAAGDYFRTFGPEDDATLLVYAATNDAGWATEVVCRVLEAGGTQPDGCADVKLCLVDDRPQTLERFARRAHAVVSANGSNWLPLRRPTYGWDALARLRDHAERFWGQHERDTPPPYSYEAAIDHAVERGWTSERHARSGSVPERSLERAIAAFETHLPATAPRVLHVGNFLGISLSYLLDWALAREGIVVSVDPDIPHRGVERPQDAVNDLLGHFGLTQRHLLICGYSLEKCFSNDSVVFEGYDPGSAWTQETAPENVLVNLADCGHRFDAAFIDGNHDPVYLRRELAEITRMLVPGGVLVLDDVDEAWDQIRHVFEDMADGDWPYESVQADGRIGILRRL